MTQSTNPPPLRFGSEVEFREGIEFSGRFLMGESTVHEALAKLARRMDEADIPYALVGAMAMNAHGYRRVTVDIDLVITAEGLARFKELWLGRGYVEKFSGSRAIRDTEYNVPIDFLLSGGFPGDGKPKGVRFPDPRGATARLDGVSVLPLERIVELKLASGMSAPHRLKDLADVIELVRTLDLDEALGDRLDSSVRDKYRELWKAARSAGPDDPR